MPGCHSGFHCHTQTKRPDGLKNMLGEGIADEIERRQIAVLNRTSLISRLSYQVEEAQLKANSLRE